MSESNESQKPLDFALRERIAAAIEFREVVRGAALAEVKKSQYRVSLTIDVHVADAESAVVEAAQIFRSMLAADISAGEGPWFDVVDPSVTNTGTHHWELQEPFERAPR